MNIYERIAEIKAELAYLERHRYMLKDYEKKIKELKEKKNELEKTLTKENKDVENLENTTLTSLFYVLVGSKEKKLEKEQYEAMQASIAFHDVLNEYKMSVESYRYLKERYAKEKELIHELETLYLEISSDDHKKDFQKLKDELNDREILLKELDEALNAGEEAYVSLKEVESYLRSAKNWGLYDMVGGDFISSMIKHGKINKAQEVMSQTRVKLRSFENELKDVETFDIQIPTFSSLDYMFDVIFDNIFSDLMTQSKVNNGLANIIETLQKVEQIIVELKEDKKKCLIEKKERQEKIKNILYHD